MDALATVRRRLVTQRLGGEPFDEAAEVVRWLGAVQAQEFADAKWSLGERMREGTTDADVEAAFARGEIVRTHVLRPTWHFVAREDARWLLRLTRPRVHALNRYWYGQLELDAKVLARCHATIARMLGDGEPRIRSELAAGLAAAGIECAGHRLGYVLMHAELEELICSGARRGKQQTWALMDERVPPGPLDDLGREGALAELALRYFRSHGPATIRDLAAWASLTVTDAKAAVAEAGGALVCEQDAAGVPWFSAPHEIAPSGRAAGAFLIPMYDETIVAYKDLRVVLAGPRPRAGSLDRAIVIDGRTVGSWRRTLAPRSVTLEASLFAPLTPRHARELDAVVERFGRFLGLSATLAVTRGPSV